MECVPVQVDRVLCVRVRVRRMILSGIRNVGGKTPTHWSTKGARRDADLNALVCLEAVDGPLWQKVRRLLCATQNLQQYRDARRIERIAIDVERRVRDILCSRNVKNYVSFAHKERSPV